MAALETSHSALLAKIAAMNSANERLLARLEKLERGRADSEEIGGLK